MNPLSKLPSAEARPTSRSLKPCVRARSAGESWSASKVEPPTKQKFQPNPSRNNATPSGRTSGEIVAAMQATTKVAEPIKMTTPRPHRSASRPEIIENAYDLSVSKYKNEVYEEINYEAPQVILSKLSLLEDEIAKGIKELKEIL